MSVWACLSRGGCWVLGWVFFFQLGLKTSLVRAISLWGVGLEWTYLLDRVSQEVRALVSQIIITFSWVWNTLPYEIRSSNTISSFKLSLKTYLFQQSYWLCGGGKRVRDRERTSGLLRNVRGFSFFFFTYFFHLMGLVLRRRNGTEKNTLLLFVLLLSSYPQCLWLGAGTGVAAAREQTEGADRAAGGHPQVRPGRKGKHHWPIRQRERYVWNCHLPWFQSYQLKQWEMGVRQEWGFHCVGSRGSLLVQAPDSWSKGCKFESQQEGRENFLLQSQLCVLTHFHCLFHPCVTTVACKRPWSFCQKLQVAGYT